ncbi:MAG: type VI-B CRISPR-associated RNA-guided ribonuclease Cas13b, partial [Bacteroidales bacterium]|nr:type VI-B CRISPR-associated RNA-guided ribonuclease Cas13b [Bacteroidales bacterium]
ASYLNMARANLFNVLCYISAQCGEKIDCDEENMHRLRVVRFADKIKHPEQQEKVFRLLLRHIPILQYMSQSAITQAKPARKGKPAVEEHNQVEYEDLQHLIEDIIGVLSFKRNLLTHANHYDSDEEIANELERERRLFSPLNNAFLGSKREAKRIYKFTEADMDFVDQDERMEKQRDENGKPLKNENGKPIYTERPDWFFRLYDVEEVEDGKKEFRLTAAGLTFLLCKLLHKKYASQLAQKTGMFRSPAQNGYSPFNKNENEAMFTIFCVRRILLPRGRVESSTENPALGMDMLNELQKCPAELFDTLCPKDKKLFQVVRKDDKPLPDPDDDINLFRRNGDRFPYLALRYVDAMRNADKDEDKVLKSIVFQVSLGKYRYKFYNRASIDTTEKDRVRVLQKEINGFGPIDKVDELRTSENYYKDLIRPVSDNPNQLYDPDTADTEPYLTDHHAAYAITGNRIGLMWNDADNEGAPLDNDTLCFLPNLPGKSKDLKLVDIQNNLVPRAWLSIHDLPAMMFLHLLGGNPEDVIISTFKKQRKFLKAIRDGKLVPQGDNWEECLEEKKDKKDKYDLKVADVPDKIVEYLKANPLPEDADLEEYENAATAKAEKDFIEWVDKQFYGDDANKRQGMIKSLENRIEKFREELKMVGGKMNRVGRKDYVEIRPGALARYLAKDIMRFTKPDDSCHNNGKPSGLDYGVLTAAMARFKGGKDKLADTELGAMIKAAINTKNHPFLDVVLDKQAKDTVQLYLNYQKAKYEFLKGLRESCKYKDCWFLREAYRNRVAKTPSYMQSDKGLANRYFDTLQLPDGLFDDAIRQQLKTLGKTKL